MAKASKSEDNQQKMYLQALEGMKKVIDDSDKYLVDVYAGEGLLFGVFSPKNVGSAGDYDGFDVVVYDHESGSTYLWGEGESMQPKGNLAGFLKRDPSFELIQTFLDPSEGKAPSDIHIPETDWKDDVMHTRKALSSVSSDWMPYDYVYTLAPFIVGIEGIRKYYKDGSGVRGMDGEGRDRLDICVQILDNWTGYFLLQYIDEAKAQMYWVKLWNCVQEHLQDIWD